MTTLGYWDTRGNTSPIRYLLAYLSVNYTSKTYTGNGKDWYEQDKLTLNSKYPNIPYYIE